MCDVILEERGGAKVPVNITCVRSRKTMGPNGCYGGHIPDWWDEEGVRLRARRKSSSPLPQSVVMNWYIRLDSTFKAWVDVNKSYTQRLYGYPRTQSIREEDTIGGSQ